MTALQLAQDECANFRDGRCVGAIINADLSITRCAPQPRCRIAAGARCPYFDVCVVPMAATVSDPRRAVALLDALTQYRILPGDGAPADRACPGCGGPIRSRMRYCPACADARRKATFRAAQARHRGSRVGMSTVSAENTPGFQGNRGVFSAVSQNAIGDGHPPETHPLTVDIAPLAEARP
jgi:hypothetical protein